MSLPTKRALVMLLAALAAVPTVLHAQTHGDAAVMRINGQTVYAAEFALVLDNIIEQSRQAGQELTAREAFPAAVKRVIEQKLLSQEARRRGLEPNEAAVQETLNEVIAEAGGRGPFASRLARVGHSLELFAESMRETDLVQQLVQQRIKPSIEVTDTEVRAYWRTHPDLFSHPEQLRLRQILCPATDASGAVSRSAATQCAATALERIAAGEPFAVVAQELSQGPAADLGGDLGFVDPARLPSAVAEVAWGLEPGAVSEPITTDAGVHVITVDAHRPAGVSPLDEVRSQVVSLVRIERSSEIVESLVAQLRDQAEIESVEDAPTLPELLGESDGS